MTISNWNGSNRCTPARIEEPDSVPRVIAIVQDTRTYPSPVRAMGELHSLNESIETNGTAVFMRRFQKIEPDLAAMTVTVGAGVTMIRLNRELRKLGVQLPVVPEIGNATAGSVACCGTKDSSFGAGGLGQISSTVCGVRMITADGRDVHVTNDKQLRVIRSSYGLLGIVHEVTFRVQKREKVTYSYGRMPLKPLPTLEEVLGDAQGFLGFLLPYRGKMLVERRSSPRRFAGPIMGLDRLKLALRTLAWKTGARPFMLPRVLPWRIRRRLIWLYVAVLERGLDLFFLSALGRFASYRADAMIDFRRPAASYFDFTFWAFPVDQWDRIVPAYLDFCERFRRETGFRPALPTEVYFIRRDDSALLSFCPDQDIFTLDMVNWSDEEPACWAAMNRAFNEFAADHGGRPLLNQTKQLLPKVARRLWNERWETLGKQRRECDPHGRFLTPFLAGIVP